MRIFFEQVQYDIGLYWCPIAAFVISFAVFIACLWRASRLPKANAEHMASLPLEEDVVSKVSSHNPNPSHANE